MPNSVENDINVRSKVVKMIAEYFDKTEVDVADSTSFVNDLGADSLDVVELLMKFEEEFGIEIAEEESSKLQTVGEAIDCISKKVSS